MMRYTDGQLVDKGLIIPCKPYFIQFKTKGEDDMKTTEWAITNSQAKAAPDLFGEHLPDGTIFRFMAADVGPFSRLTYLVTSRHARSIPHASDVIKLDSEDRAGLEIEIASSVSIDVTWPGQVVT